MIKSLRERALVKDYTNAKQLTEDFAKLAFQESRAWWEPFSKVAKSVGESGALDQQGLETINLSPLFRCAMFLEHRLSSIQSTEEAILQNCEVAKKVRES
jgi:hypothetical protein